MQQQVFCPVKLNEFPDIQDETCFHVIRSKKKIGNPGSVVAQGSRFPGGVEVVFQLPSMGGARIFTGTAISPALGHKIIIGSFK